MTAEPPLTRQESLHRAVQMCGICLLNATYYSAGRDGDKTFFEGSVHTLISNNFIDMAVLEWCKLFGEPKHEPHHWQRLLDIGKHKAFNDDLLNHLECEKRDWKRHRMRSIDYRNEFLAHVGEGRTMHLPHLDLTRRSALYYAKFLMEHENDGRTYGALLATDPDAFYRHHLQEGMRFYGRLKGM